MDGYHIQEEKMTPINFLEPQRLICRALPLVCVALLVCAPARAAEQSDWKQIETEAVAAMDRQDCAGAWKVLWPVARTGQAEALTLLTQLVMFRDLVPPKSISPSETASLEEQRVDHLLALAMADWKNLTQDDGLTAADLVSGIAEERGGENDKRLDSCMQATEDKAQCVKLATELKLVPTFDDYVKAMDGATAPAACLPDNRPKK